ncbi:MAG: bifunctional orotidine-5'-phosphate decarboxylase/orotate phosphoribosyltransferase [Kovacikia sp.]
MNFFDKLNGAIVRNQSLLYVGLDPSPEVWPECYAAMERTQAVYSPAGMLSGHQPMRELQTWLKFLIDETADLVCAYKLNPEFYRILGVAGLELFHQTLASIPADIPVILDANHGDLNSSAIFAQTIFRDWQVDAVTLNPYAGQDLAAPFLVHPDKAIFVLCTTTNPAAQVLQSYPASDNPFYLQLVQETKTWGTPEQVGLEVGASTPEVLARIRSIAPERVILARSVWTEGSDLNQILEAGLNQEGSGLLIPVPAEVLARPQLSGATSSLKPIQALSKTINQVRAQVSDRSPACSVWMPDICLLQQHPHEKLILQLFDLGCLQFGEFVQASGATFPYYVDLRTIISNPQIFDQVIRAYAEILKPLNFDRIAGIPYGALPTATGLALHLNCPMIFPRKEVKAHGARRLVEGNFCPGETAVVIDDIFITGNSAIEGAAKLKSVGLQVNDIVVFIDHEQGVKERLKQAGYTGYAVLTMSEIGQTLFEAGRLNQAQWQALSLHQSAVSQPGEMDATVAKVAIAAATTPKPKVIN